MLNKYEAIINVTMEELGLYNSMYMIVKTAVKKMCKVLEIEEPTLKISNEFTRGGGCYIHELNELHISRSMASLESYHDFERIMEIISHELRHKFQYDTGMFNPEDPYITPEEGYEAYRNQPIEADAFEFGEYMRSILAEFILKSLENKFQMELKISARRNAERAELRSRRPRR